MDGQGVFLVRFHGAREPAAGGEQDEAGVVQQGLFQDVVSGVAVVLQVADDDVQAQVESGDAEEIAGGVQHRDVAGEQIARGGGVAGVGLAPGKIAVALLRSLVPVASARIVGRGIGSAARVYDVLAVRESEKQQVERDPLEPEIFVLFGGGCVRGLLRQAVVEDAHNGAAKMVQDMQTAFFDVREIVAVDGLVCEMREVDLAVVHGGIQQRCGRILRVVSQ